jgi:hypothetical protein
VATVTSYTAARMKEIEDAAIVGGVIDGDDLVLTRFDGTTVVAGDVRGPQGPMGSTGDTAILIVTSTTRPGSPFAGLVIYETDTDQFWKYNGTDWVYMGGVIVCTSSTRPSAPFIGLSIYETDTKRPYTWNGTAWSYTGGTILCTSTTRPTATLFDGMKIYETDTKRNYTYNGALWVPAAGEMRCKAVGHGVVSNVVFTTQDYDTDNIWTPGATADSFIIPANGAGLWRFIFDAQFYINGTGARHLGMTKNSGAGFATWNAAGEAAWFVGSTVVAELVLAPGDIIKAYAYHTAGVVLNLDNNYPINMSAVFLGA